MFFFINVMLLYDLWIPGREAKVKCVFLFTSTFIERYNMYSLIHPISECVGFQIANPNCFSFSLILILGAVSESGQSPQKLGLTTLDLASGNYEKEFLRLRNYFKQS